MRAFHITVSFAIHDYEVGKDNYFNTAEEAFDFYIFLVATLKHKPENIKVEKIPVMIYEYERG